MAGDCKVEGRGRAFSVSSVGSVGGIQLWIQSPGSLALPNQVTLFLLKSTSTSQTYHSLRSEDQHVGGGFLLPWNLANPLSSLLFPLTFAFCGYKYLGYLYLLFLPSHITFITNSLY